MKSLSIDERYINDINDVLKAGGSFHGQIRSNLVKFSGLLGKCETECDQILKNTYDLAFIDYQINKEDLDVQKMCFYLAIEKHNESFLLEITQKILPTVTTIEKEYYYLNAVSVFFETNELMQASILIKSFLEEFPKNSIAWYLNGRLFFYQSNFDEAEKSFLKSIELNPNSPANYDLGSLYYNKAIEIYNNHKDESEYKFKSNTNFKVFISKAEKFFLQFSAANPEDKSVSEIIHNLEFLKLLE